MTERRVNHPITITTRPGSVGTHKALIDAAARIAATIAPLHPDQHHLTRAVLNASHWERTTDPATLTLTYPAPLGTGPNKATLETNPYGLTITYYCPTCETPLHPDLWTEGHLPHDHVERDGNDLLVFAHHTPPDTITEQPARVGPLTEEEDQVNKYLATELDPTVYRDLTWTVTLKYTRHTHDPHTGLWRYRLNLTEPQ